MGVVVGCCRRSVGCSRDVITKNLKVAVSSNHSARSDNGLLSMVSLREHIACNVVVWGSG